MTHPSPYQSKREGLLAQLASIDTIERGSLHEEYRKVPDPKGGGTLRKGPYYKHQCWEDKRNRSKRIPAHEIPLLREDLENGKRFQLIIEELSELNTANARERRGALRQSDPGCGPGQKKTPRASAP